MPTLEVSFAGMVAALVDRYGRPGESRPGIGDDPFEAILRAALSRTVEDRKVVAALAALREAGLLEPGPLAEAEPTEIVEAIRLAGVALPPPALKGIRKLAGWIADGHGGEPGLLAEVSTERLRDELRGLNGVGPATADAILLFALRRPTYPVDRASVRVLVRHGWFEPTGEYDEARGLLESAAGDDPEALARLSGWLERVGRDACRPSVAKCERCPLRPFLSEGGPIEPDRSSG